MMIEVRGKKLFFDVLGSDLAIDGADISEKPNLILLHGGPGGSDHTVYRPIFDHLSDIT